MSLDSFRRGCLEENQMCRPRSLGGSCPELQGLASETVTLEVGVTLVFVTARTCGAAETSMMMCVLVVIVGEYPETASARSKPSLAAGLGLATRVSGSGRSEDIVGYVSAMRFLLALVCLLRVRFEHLDWQFAHLLEHVETRSKRYRWQRQGQVVLARCSGQPIVQTAQS